MNTIKMWPQLAAQKFTRLPLVTLALSISIPCTVMAQRESAEERMNRLYSPRVVVKANGDKTIGSNTKVDQKFPNVINEKLMYLFFLKSEHKYKSTGKTFAIDIDQANEFVKQYIKDVKKIDLNRFDEFDQRRQIAQTKQEIKDEILSLDYNTVYTNTVMVGNIEDYNFKTHELPFWMRNEITSLRTFNSFSFLFLNVPKEIFQIWLPLNEEEAEKTVKRVGSQDANYAVAAVEHFKISPMAIHAQNGYGFLMATLTKVEFYYKIHTEGTKWEYGEKIGERIIPTDPWSHPQIR